jgi:MFS family permease
MLLPSLDTSIANVALPALAESWGTSFGEVRWIVLAYLLALTGIVAAAGRLGDRFGRRRVLAGGVVLFTASALLSGLAQSLPLLIASRTLEGVGAAVMIALSMALAMDAVPEARTGRALGLLGSMSAVGTTLGPSLGGLLIAGFGWRAIFLFMVPLGIVTLLLVMRGLPSDPPEKGRPRDKEAFRTVLRALLADRGLAAGLTLSTIVANVMMATLIVGPFYLSQGLALGPAQVGLAMSAGPFAAALAGLPAGRLVDRLGTNRVALLGLVGMTAGLLALALLPESFGVGGYIAGIAVVTVHYALFQTANNSGVMVQVPPGRRGTVSGMLSLSRNLGLIAGAFAMGGIFACASSALGVAAGMRTTFAVAALLVMIALAVATLEAARAAMLTGRRWSWQSGRPERV